MKVLLINAVCGSGSTGRIVTDLAAALRTRGHTPLVAFGVGQAGSIDPGDTFKMNHPLGYYSHNALSRLTDHAGLYSRHQTQKLIRKIREFDPDIVHIHTLHGYYVNYELLLSDLAETGKPVVMTLHDCWCFTGHCTHFGHCRQWHTRCGRCSRLRHYPSCYLQGDVGRNFDRKKAAFSHMPNLHIVTPSRWLAELASQSFLGIHPIHVIPNGIDLDLFRPTSGTGLPSGKPVVLGVAGVWNQSKGLQDFYALADRLEENYQVVLVGLTPEQKQTLPGNILGICRTESREQLAALYTAADIFVNPTYEDTYPTVNLEAQACGTPVVTYATGGSPETLLPGMGRVVPRGDIQQLEHVIREGIPVPRKISLSPLDKTVSCGHYLGLYETLWGR